MVEWFKCCTPETQSERATTLRLSLHPEANATLAAYLAAEVLVVVCPAYNGINVDQVTKLEACARTLYTWARFPTAPRAFSGFLRERKGKRRRRPYQHSDSGARTRNSGSRPPVPLSSVFLSSLPHAQYPRPPRPCTYHFMPAPVKSPRRKSSLPATFKFAGAGLGTSSSEPEPSPEPPSLADAATQRRHTTKRRILACVCLKLFSKMV